MELNGVFLDKVDLHRILTRQLPSAPLGQKQTALKLWGTKPKKRAKKSDYLVIADSRALISWN